MPRRYKTSYEPRLHLSRRIVPIDEAAKIYQAATRYLGLSTPICERNYGSAPAVEAGDVLVTELNKQYLRGAFSGHHQMMSDEPKSFGGHDLGLRLANSSFGR